MTRTTSAQSQDSFTSKFLMLRRACFMLALCVATAIASPAQVFDTLIYFNDADGAGPNGLIQATDGNLYGTTNVGGANGYGTVFEITPAGALTTLYSFCSLANCADGKFPYSLIQGSDGNFYGVTGAGGSSSYCPDGFGCGTIFEITASGAFSTLYNFCSQSGCPDGGTPSWLMQATDGNFYGTTEGFSCWLGVCGSIFKMTPAGVLTTLHAYNGADGQGPAQLIQASNGNFYGITAFTYAQILQPYGTLFDITPGGDLTTLATFPYEQSPLGILQGIDGNFYGTTSKVGAYNTGTIYEVTPEGVLSTVYNFDTSLWGTTTGLVQGTDGTFYGTVLGGPSPAPWYYPWVFEIPPGGTLTYLHVYSDGMDPTWIMQTHNGTAYVTTSSANGGNDACCGAIFSFSEHPAVTLSTSSLSFGDNQAVDETSASQSVTLTRNGVVLLSVSNVAVSGNFAITKNTCSGAMLRFNQDCSVRVAFTPTALGPQTGTLTFADNGSNSPQTVTLSGTGVAQATLTPSSYNFSETFPGLTSPPRSFELMNNLSATLTGISFSTTGDFGISASTCGTTLSAKTSCTISVTFTPTQKGIRTGQLSVSDSANNTPQTVSLSGTGD